MILLATGNLQTSDFDDIRVGEVDGRVVYVSKDVYQQAIRIFYRFDGSLEAVCRVMGENLTHKDIVSEFYQNAPEPLNILAPFLGLTDDGFKFSAVEDQYGLLHHLSTIVDFNEFLLVPEDVRKGVVVSATAIHSYKDSWKRLLTEKFSMREEIPVAIDELHKHLDTLIDVVTGVKTAMAEVSNALTKIAEKDMAPTVNNNIPMPQFQPVIMQPQATGMQPTGSPMSYGQQTNPVLTTPGESKSVIDNVIGDSLDKFDWGDDENVGESNTETSRKLDETVREENSNLNDGEAGQDGVADSLTPMQRLSLYLTESEDN